MYYIIAVLFLLFLIYKYQNTYSYFSGNKFVNTSGIMKNGQRVVSESQVDQTNSKIIQRMNGIAI